MRRVISARERRGRLEILIQDKEKKYFRSTRIKDFYLVSEVQKLFNIKHRRTIYSWIDEGKLKAFKEGRIVRIPYFAIIEFIKKRVF